MLRMLSFFVFILMTMVLLSSSSLVLCDGGNSSTTTTTTTSIPITTTASSSSTSTNTMEPTTIISSASTTMTAATPPPASPSSPKNYINSSYQLGIFELHGISAMSLKPLQRAAMALTTTTVPSSSSSSGSFYNYADLNELLSFIINNTSPRRFKSLEQELSLKHFLERKQKTDGDGDISLTTTIKEVNSNNNRNKIENNFSSTKRLWTCTNSFQRQQGIAVFNGTGASAKAATGFFDNRRIQSLCVSPHWKNISSSSSSALSSSLQLCYDIAAYNRTGFSTIFQQLCPPSSSHQRIVASSDMIHQLQNTTNTKIEFSPSPRMKSQGSTALCDSDSHLDTFVTLHFASSSLQKFFSIKSFIRVGDVACSKINLPGAADDHISVIQSSDGKISASLLSLEDNNPITIRRIPQVNSQSSPSTIGSSPLVKINSEQLVGSCFSSSSSNGNFGIISLTRETTTTSSGDFIDIVVASPSSDSIINIKSRLTLQSDSILALSKPFSVSSKNNGSNTSNASSSSMIILFSALVKTTPTSSNAHLLFCQFDLQDANCSSSPLLVQPLGLSCARTVSLLDNTNNNEDEIHLQTISPPSTADDYSKNASTSFSSIVIHQKDSALYTFTFNPRTIAEALNDIVGNGNNNTPIDVSSGTSSNLDSIPTLPIESFVFPPSIIDLSSAIDQSRRKFLGVIPDHDEGSAASSSSSSSSTVSTSSDRVLPPVLTLNSSAIDDIPWIFRGNNTCYAHLVFAAAGTSSSKNNNQNSSIEVYRLCDGFNVSNFVETQQHEDDHPQCTLSLQNVSSSSSSSSSSISSQKETFLLSNIDSFRLLAGSLRIQNEFTFQNDAAQQLSLIISPSETTLMFLTLIMKPKLSSQQSSSTKLDHLCSGDSTSYLDFVKVPSSIHKTTYFPVVDGAPCVSGMIDFNNSNAIVTTAPPLALIYNQLNARNRENLNLTVHRIVSASTSGAFSSELSGYSVLPKWSSLYLTLEVSSSSSSSSKNRNSSPRRDQILYEAIFNSQYGHVEIRHPLANLSSSSSSSSFVPVFGLNRFLVTTDVEVTTKTTLLNNTFDNAYYYQLEKNLQDHSNSSTSASFFATAIESRTTFDVSVYGVDTGWKHPIPTGSPLCLLRARGGPGICGKLESDSEPLEIYAILDSNLDQFKALGYTIPNTTGLIIGNWSYFLTPPIRDSDPMSVNEKYELPILAAEGSCTMVPRPILYLGDDDLVTNKARGFFAGGGAGQQEEQQQTPSTEHDDDRSTIEDFVTMLCFSVATWTPDTPLPKPSNPDLIVVIGRLQKFSPVTGSTVSLANFLAPAYVRNQEYTSYFLSKNCIIVTFYGADTIGYSCGNLPTFSWKSLGGSQNQVNSKLEKNDPKEFYLKLRPSDTRPFFWRVAFLNGETFYAILDYKSRSTISFFGPGPKPIGPSDLATPDTTTTVNSIETCAGASWEQFRTGEIYAEAFVMIWSLNWTDPLTGEQKRTQRVTLETNNYYYKTGKMVRDKIFDRIYPEEVLIDPDQNLTMLGLWCDAASSRVLGLSVYNITSPNPDEQKYILFGLSLPTPGRPSPNLTAFINWRYDANTLITNPERVVPLSSIPSAKSGTSVCEFSLAVNAAGAGETYGLVLLTDPSCKLNAIDFYTGENLWSIDNYIPQRYSNYFSPGASPDASRNTPGVIEVRRGVFLFANPANGMIELRRAKDAKIVGRIGMPTSVSGPLHQMTLTASSTAFVSGSDYLRQGYLWQLLPDSVFQLAPRSQPMMVDISNALYEQNVFLLVQNMERLLPSWRRYNYYADWEHVSCTTHWVVNGTNILNDETRIVETEGCLSLLLLDKEGNNNEGQQDESEDFILHHPPQGTTLLPSQISYIGKGSLYEQEIVSPVSSLLDFNLPSNGSVSGYFDFLSIGSVSSDDYITRPHLRQFNFGGNKLKFTTVPGFVSHITVCDGYQSPLVTQKIVRQIFLDYIDSHPDDSDHDNNNNNNNNSSSSSMSNNNNNNNSTKNRKQIYHNIDVDPFILAVQKLPTANVSRSGDINLTYFTQDTTCYSIVDASESTVIVTLDSLPSWRPPGGATFAPQPGTAPSTTFDVDPNNNPIFFYEMMKQYDDDDDISKFVTKDDDNVYQQGMDYYGNFLYIPTKLYKLPNNQVSSSSTTTGSPSPSTSSSTSISSGSSSSSSSNNNDNITTTTTAAPSATKVDIITQQDIDQLNNEIMKQRNKWIPTLLPVTTVIRANNVPQARIVSSEDELFNAVPFLHELSLKRSNFKFNLHQDFIPPQAYVKMNDISSNNNNNADDQTTMTRRTTATVKTVPQFLSIFDLSDNIDVTGTVPHLIWPALTALHLSNTSIKRRPDRVTMSLIFYLPEYARNNLRMNLEEIHLAGCNNLDICVALLDGETNELNPVLPTLKIINVSGSRIVAAIDLRQTARIYFKKLYPNREYPLLLQRLPPNSTFSTNNSSSSSSSIEERNEFIENFYADNMNVTIDIRRSTVTDQSPNQIQIACPLKNLQGPESLYLLPIQTSILNASHRVLYDENAVWKCKYVVSRQQGADEYIRLAPTVSVAYEILLLQQLFFAPGIQWCANDKFASGGGPTSSPTMIVPSSTTTTAAVTSSSFPSSSSLPPPPLITTMAPASSASASSSSNFEQDVIYIGRFSLFKGLGLPEISAQTSQTVFVIANDNTNDDDNNNNDDQNNDNNNQQILCTLPTAWISGAAVVAPLLPAAMEKLEPCIAVFRKRWLMKKMKEMNQTNKSISNNNYNNLQKLFDNASSWVSSQTNVGTGGNTILSICFAADKNWGNVYTTVPPCRERMEVLFQSSECGLVNQLLTKNLSTSYCYNDFDSKTSAQYKISLTPKFVFTSYTDNTIPAVPMLTVVENGVDVKICTFEMPLTVLANFTVFPGQSFFESIQECLTSQRSQATDDGQNNNNNVVSKNSFQFKSFVFDSHDDSFLLEMVDVSVGAGGGGGGGGGESIQMRFSHRVCTSSPGFPDINNFVCLSAPTAPIQRPSIDYTRARQEYVKISFSVWPASLLTAPARTVLWESCSSPSSSSTDQNVISSFAAVGLCYPLSKIFPQTANLPPLSSSLSPSSSSATSSNNNNSSSSTNKNQQQNLLQSAEIQTCLSKCSVPNQKLPGSTVDCDQVAGWILNATMCLLARFPIHPASIFKSILDSYDEDSNKINSNVNIAKCLSEAETGSTIKWLFEMLNRPMSEIGIQFVVTDEATTLDFDDRYNDNDGDDDDNFIKKLSKQSSDFKNKIYFKTCFMNSTFQRLFETDEAAIINETLDTWSTVFDVNESVAGDVLSKIFRTVGAASGAFFEINPGECYSNIKFSLTPCLPYFTLLPGSYAAPYLLMLLATVKDIVVMIIGFTILDQEPVREITKKIMAWIVTRIYPFTDEESAIWATKAASRFDPRRVDLDTFFELMVIFFQDADGLKDEWEDHWEHNFDQYVQKGGTGRIANTNDSSSSAGTGDDHSQRQQTTVRKYLPWLTNLFEDPEVLQNDPRRRNMNAPSSASSGGVILQDDDDGFLGEEMLTKTNNNGDSNNSASSLSSSSTSSLSASASSRSNRIKNQRLEILPVRAPTKEAAIRFSNQQQKLQRSKLKAQRKREKLEEQQLEEQFFTPKEGEECEDDGDKNDNSNNVMTPKEIEEKQQSEYSSTNNIPLLNGGNNDNDDDDDDQPAYDYEAEDEERKKLRLSNNNNNKRKSGLQYHDSDEDAHERIIKIKDASATSITERLSASSSLNKSKVKKKEQHQRSQTSSSSYEQAPLSAHSKPPLSSSSSDDDNNNGKNNDGATKNEKNSKTEAEDITLTDRTYHASSGFFFHHNLDEGEVRFSSQAEKALFTLFKKYICKDRKRVILNPEVVQPIFISWLREIMEGDDTAKLVFNERKLTDNELILLRKLQAASTTEVVTLSSDYWGERFTPQSWQLLMSLFFGFVNIIVLTIHTVPRAPSLRNSNWAIYENIFFMFVNSGTSVGILNNALMRRIFFGEFTFDPILILSLIICAPALITHIIPGAIIFAWLPILTLLLCSLGYRFLIVTLRNRIEMQSSIKSKSTVSSTILFVNAMWRNLMVFIANLVFCSLFNYMVLFYGVQSGLIAKEFVGGYWEIVAYEFESRSLYCTLSAVADSVSNNMQVISSVWV